MFSSIMFIDGALLFQTKSQDFFLEKKIVEYVFFHRMGELARWSCIQWALEYAAGRWAGKISGKLWAVDTLQLKFLCRTSPCNQNYHFCQNYRKSCLACFLRHFSCVSTSFPPPPLFLWSQPLHLQNMIFIPSHSPPLGFALLFKHFPT